MTPKLKPWQNDLKVQPVFEELGFTPQSGIPWADSPESFFEDSLTGEGRSRSQIREATQSLDSIEWLEHQEPYPVKLEVWSILRHREAIQGHRFEAAKVNANVPGDAERIEEDGSRVTGTYFNEESSKSDTLSAITLDSTGTKSDNEEVRTNADDVQRDFGERPAPNGIPSVMKPVDKTEKNGRLDSTIYLDRKAFVSAQNEIAVDEISFVNSDDASKSLKTLRDTRVPFTDLGSNVPDTRNIRYHMDDANVPAGCPGSMPKPGLKVEDGPSFKTKMDEPPIIPKLEEPIPGHLLPEVLILSAPLYMLDPYGSKEPSPRSMKYRRVFPPIEPRTDSFKPPSVGHLNLNEAHKLGSGNHSRAYRGALRLPETFTVEGSSTGEVYVAVKIPAPLQSDRRMLEHEAEAYTLIPSHFSEDYSGYYYMHENLYSGNGIVPAKAVVPRFYGYYSPDKTEEEDHWYEDPSDIMLLEECGTALVCPSQLTPPQREELYSFGHRLFRENITQGSPYIRNTVMQPGPLHEPPSKRSMNTPSFRMIDFGRCRIEKMTKKGSRSLHILPDLLSSDDTWTDQLEWERRKMKDLVYGKKLEGKDRPFLGKI